MMTRIERVVWSSAVAAGPHECLARYEEDIHASGEGAWMFAYFLLFLMAVNYIRDEWKKSTEKGVMAVGIVGTLVGAAYAFPIINGILVGVVVLAFAYGMYKQFF